MTAFQAVDGGSIPPTRTTLLIALLSVVGYFDLFDFIGLAQCKPWTFLSLFFCASFESTEGTRKMKLGCWSIPEESYY
jgi:hypothetical protein